MRCIRIVVLCLVALFGLSATGAASASAEELGRDWTINGVPLKTGVTEKAKLTSLTSTQISIPGLGVDVICSKLSANGTLVGGEVGTGTFKLKLTGCSISGEPACKIKLVGEKQAQSEPDEVTYPSGGTIIQPTVIIRPNATLVVKKCPLAGSYEMEGDADSIGPVENAISFPEEPLPASTLTVDGLPAVFQGADLFTLPKGAELGTGAL